MNIVTTMTFFISDCLRQIDLMIEHHPYIFIEKYFFDAFSQIKIISNAIPNAVFSQGDASLEAVEQNEFHYN